MKRQQLKFPYRWEDRRPEIAQGVFFIPGYYFAHREWRLPTWDLIFGNDAPVIVEYGAGNGTWIIDKAADDSKNWVAVERRFDRVQKIWNKMQNRQLKNLFVVCGEAEVFTKNYLHSNSVEQVFINFPDPWPKVKHAKLRLFQASFIEDLNQVLKSPGEMVVVTDDKKYGEQILGTVLSNSLWNSVFPDPYFVTEWDGYVTSYFHTLWLEKGRTIYYFHFKKS